MHDGCCSRGSWCMIITVVWAHSARRPLLWGLKKITAENKKEQRNRQPLEVHRSKLQGLRKLTRACCCTLSCILSHLTSPTVQSTPTLEVQPPAWTKIAHVQLTAAVLRLEHCAHTRSPRPGRCAARCPGSTCGGHAGLHAPGAPAGQHNRIKRPSLRLDEDANT
eukprot:scaffold205156_cov22-Tisochrysis_lutea.AAC.1